MLDSNSTLNCHQVKSCGLKKIKEEERQLLSQRTTHLIMTIVKVKAKKRVFYYSLQDVQTDHNCKKKFKRN